MVTLFYHNSSPFSQWYPAKYVYNGIEFSCAEQGMMYGKAKLFDDDKIADEILRTKDPKTMKSLGRKVHNFNEKRWAEYRELIVLNNNIEKFKQNPKLAKALLDTGDTIIAEASPRDKIWGIGLSAKDKRAQDTYSWLGANLLGEILMDVREHLRTSQTLKQDELEDESIQ